LREAAPVRRDGSLSLREGVLVPGRRPHYLRHLREAGRPVCERQCQSGRTGRSVCERECRSCVAGPIIYGTCARRVTQFARGSAGPARRVAQFARGSAGPGPPAPLFTALPQGGSLSLREAVRSWVAGPIIYGTSGGIHGGAVGRPKVDGKTRHFGNLRRHFLDSVENSDGK